MDVIGITGGIGSGKSTVSDYLRSLGYEIIDVKITLSLSKKTNINIRKSTLTT